MLLLSYSQFALYQHCNAFKKHHRKVFGTQAFGCKSEKWKCRPISMPLNVRGQWNLIHSLSPSLCVCLCVCVLLVYRTHGTLLVGDAWGRVFSWTCEGWKRSTKHRSQPTHHSVGTVAQISFTPAAVHPPSPQHTHTPQLTSQTRTRRADFKRWHILSWTLRCSGSNQKQDTAYLRNERCCKFFFFSVWATLQISFTVE